MTKSKLDKSFGLLHCKFFADNDVIAISHNHHSPKNLKLMIYSYGMFDSVIEIDTVKASNAKDKLSKMIINLINRSAEILCEKSEDKDKKSHSLEYYKPGAQFNESEGFFTVIVPIEEAADLIDSSTLVLEEISEKCPYFLIVRGEESDIHRVFLLSADLSVGDTIQQALEDMEDPEDENIIIREFIDGYDRAIKGFGKNKLIKNEIMREVIVEMKLV